MLHIENMNNNFELKKYWDEQDAILKKIKEKGGMENYVKTITDLKYAFEGKDLSICCIDEGTAYGCVRFAGSLILFQNNHNKINKYIEMLKEKGVNGVYSHKGCGAAGLYVKLNNLNDKQPDEYGIEWAKKLAETLNVSYKGHIGGLDTKEQMKRPKEFHIARVIYYDGTGRFNPDKAKGLPTGFVISRKYYLSPDDALGEVRIAISIVMGNHGFGNLIDEKSPVVIIVVGDSGNPEFSAKRMEEEVSFLNKEYGGKVVVDKFTPHH